MEIAIQNGHTEVVQVLLKKRNNTLRCREAGGRTPAFTAIKYKRSEIFNILVQEGINKFERCLYRKNRIKVIDLNEMEKREYLQNLCPYNVTLSHFLAYYWEKRVFELGQIFGIGLQEMVMGLHLFIMLVVLETLIWYIFWIKMSLGLMSDP